MLLVGDGLVVGGVVLGVQPDAGHGVLLAGGIDAFDEGHKVRVYSAISRADLTNDFLKSLMDENRAHLLRQFLPRNHRKILRAGLVDKIQAVLEPQPHQQRLW